MRKIKLVLAFVALFMVSSSVFGQNNETKLSINLTHVPNYDHFYVRSIEVVITYWWDNRTWERNITGVRLNSSGTTGSIDVAIPNTLFSLADITKMYVRVVQLNNIVHVYEGQWQDLVSFVWKRALTVGPPDPGEMPDPGVGSLIIEP